HIYDIASKKINDIKVDKPYSDFYIPRIKWTNEADVLSAQFLNRHQNQLDLWLIDTNDMSSKLALEEKDNAYVDVTDNLTFLKDKSFIWTSEKDGYNHIYHHAKDGKLINQVTKGTWEVTNHYGYDKKENTVF